MGDRGGRWILVFLLVCCFALWEVRNSKISALLASNRTNRCAIRPYGWRNVTGVRKEFFHGKISLPFCTG